MKKLLFAAAAILMVCGCTVGKSPACPQSKLVITGKSNYQIVLPDLGKKDPILNHLNTGAKMIQSALKEGLGLNVPVVSESKAVQGVKAIYIGDTKAARSLGIDTAKHSSFGFTLAEKDGNIFIAGLDKHQFGKTGSSQRDWRYFILGSINGCVKFAEKYLDTRFLYPGKNGIDYAKLVRVEIPAGMREVCSPKLIFTTRSREMLYSYSNNAYGSGAFKSYGGHSYYDAVPAKKYAKTHLHYFALRGGKRNADGNHLCISNPEVQELIYQEMAKWAKDGALAVQLAQTDGYQPCECAKCKAYGNTSDQGEKLWILHRELAERLYKEQPGKFAHIICYGPTKMPPQSFKKFPPNVIIELCNYTTETFKRWRQYEVKGGFTTYVYNWGWYNRVGFLPKRTPQFCAEQVRLFLKNNVRGVYRCGFGENFGLEGPSYYVYGQMFNDITQNEDVLVDDFIRRAFHESYVPMKLFYENLFARLAIYSALEDRGASDFGRVSALPANPRVLVTSIFSADMLDILSKNLKRAEEMAKDPKVKARLELVRIEFDYVQNLAETLHLYNAYRLNPNQHSFDQLALSVDKRNALIKSYTDPKRPSTTRAYSKNWPYLPIFNAPPIKMLEENGRLSAPIGAPLNWNTKLLKEQKVLPGVGKKSLRIPRASGKVSAVDFNSGAWAKAQWNTMGGIQLGAVKEKTRFKLLYDAKNVYVAFESDLDARKSFANCGHDGPCYNQDCIDIFLDPTGTKSVNYHFIANPIPNSCYDGAFGLITDVLDPKYNKRDKEWNGKWSYETTRKGNKWYIMVTIPFSTLNTKPAAPGAIWTGNFGREAFEIPGPGVKGRGKAELSLWSPNLETMTFHDQETFGDLIFE